MPKLQPGETLVLASNNPGKLKEMREICAPYNLNLLPIGDFTKVEPVEDGGTFVANALIKARAAVKASGHICIADDSGLSVEALGGRPGVDTKPFSESHGGDYDKAAKALMDEVGAGTTPAHFTCVLALIWPDGHEEIIEERLNGTLNYPGAGDAWAFNPYFIPEGFSATMAQMDPAEKHRISHRGKAFARFIDQFVR